MVATGGSEWTCSEIETCYDLLTFRAFCFFVLGLFKEVLQIFSSFCLVRGFFSFHGF